MRTTTKGHASETIEFRLIYILCFALCLVAACIGRLLPRRYRSNADHPLGPKSISARRNLRHGHSVLPFAFM